MTKTSFFINGLCISFFLCSCGLTHNVSGKYRSNFAVHGFFVTRINLNADSTFGYRMSGDMIFDTSNGHYRLDNKYLVITHQPFKRDTSEYGKYEKGNILLSSALSTNNHLKSSEKYVIGHNKLFVCDSNGNVVRKQFGYSKPRKYLFFGKHWYKRRYYLKRVY